VTQRLRFATFNIRHGVGMDGVLDLERVAAVLEEIAADVLCLQEVDRNWGRRSGHVDQAGWLAERLGMFHVFAPNIEADPVEPASERRQYGMATLTVFPIRSTVRTLLDRPLGGEQRGLLEVGIVVGRVPMRVLNTHLEFASHAERVVQAAAIRDAVRSGPAPVVLLGDLNAEPASEEIGLVTQDLVDAWRVAGSGDGFTFDAVAPFMRIDYVLVSTEITVASAAVMPTDASDHLPVVVDVALPLPQHPGVSSGHDRHDL
jgi:endonuclease/exonuclease/phosphatase family metal-dependent hydrolase